MSLRNTVVALLALLLPAAGARGALTLYIPRFDPRPGDRGVFEVFFTETGGTPDENLVAYSVGIDLVGPPGLTFVEPYVMEPTNRPFVFPAGTPILDTGSGPTRIRALAELETGDANITDGAAVLRVPIAMAPGARGGWELRFVLTGGLTQFSDDIGGEIEFVPVNAFIGIPEPSGACLLAAAGLAALARRRK